MGATAASDDGDSHTNSHVRAMGSSVSVPRIWLVDDENELKTASAGTGGYSSPPLLRQRTKYHRSLCCSGFLDSLSGWAQGGSVVEVRE